MTVGTDTTYILPVTGAPVVTDCYGRKFTAVKVEWHTYVYEGQAYRMVRVYGTDSNGTDTNRSWDLGYEEIPEWVPRPPQAWFDLADEIAAQAVQS